MKRGRSVESVPSVGVGARPRPPEAPERGLGGERSSPPIGDAVPEPQRFKLKTEIYNTKSVFTYEKVLIFAIIIIFVP